MPFFVYSQQQQDTLRAKLLPLPSFGYAPETRAYVGAVALLTFDFGNDSTKRSSNAKAEFNYTWNKQRIVETSWNVFGKQEKLFSSGKLHYSYFPDLYYGIGNQTPHYFKTQYTSMRLVAEADLLKRISPSFFAGPALRAIYYSQLDYLTSRQYRELYPSHLWGIGAMTVLDQRNNLLNPTEGNYTAFTVLPQRFEKQLFYHLRFDTRTYIGWRKATLALRLLTETNLGEVPFYANALLGGDSNMRGYYLGRYRDKHCVVGQLEYRSGTVWKRWGYTLFSGVGDVFAQPADLHFDVLKPNAGLGLRFLVDRKESINLRLDYAIGKAGQSGFYIAFGEAF